MNDTQRLDFLQQLLDEAPYTGRAICRMSCTGRGFRLHEDSSPASVASIRQAIDNFAEENAPKADPTQDSSAGHKASYPEEGV